MKRLCMPFTGSQTLMAPWRIAVVAAHGREEVPARAAANGNLVLHGHLEGYFHGHGSGIRVKDVLQSFRAPWRAGDARVPRPACVSGRRT